MVTVVMILMNGGYLVGGIDYCRSQLTSLPNQPEIPPDAAYHQWWHGRIKPAAKSEIIHRVTRLLNTVIERESLSTLRPVRHIRINRFGDVRVPTAPHHQEWRVRIRHALQSLAKCWQQNNVAIAVTKKIVPGQFLRAAENVIKSLGAQTVAFYKRFVTKAEFPCNLRAARVVAKENNFDIWIQQLQLLSALR